MVKKGLFGLLEANLGINRVEDLILKYSQGLTITHGRKNNG